MSTPACESLAVDARRGGWYNYGKRSIELLLKRMVWYAQKKMTSDRAEKDDLTL